MKYNVYAGYYELYVTDKELPLPLTLQASYDTVEETWEYLDMEDEYTWIDEDVYYDMFSVLLDVYNPLGHVFKLDEESGEIVVLSDETIQLFN